MIFLALDNEDDRKKLLSTEVTGAWVNEGREVPKAIIDDLLGRTGRFPKMIDGGPTWHGLIMDTNAPDEEHWIPVMRGDVPPPDWMTDEQIKALEKPKNWSFYIQPAGLVEVFDEHGNLTGYEPNVRAENVRYLPKGYYDNLTAGKPKTWIDVNILNRLGTHKDGRPVWPQYSQGVHLASKPLKAYPGVDVYVGIDFGRQPAAVAAQCLRGQWLIQHELTAQNEGSSIFAPQVKKWLVQCYGPDAVFHIFGDPSGDFMGPNDDRTPYQIFRANGLHVRPAPGGNRLPLRLETVESLLVRLVDGKPALMVSPSCTTLKAALAGGYAYRRLRMSGGAKYSDEPDKNRFSHIADALQYLVLGAGEGRTVVGAGKSVKPVQTAKAFDVGRARLDPLGKRNGRRPVVRSGI
ncbi:MAG: hypothetical protein HXY25_06990 [Alphaproteobacteria bacterium]|nr:hypothetical protein [Alphaproteobacteria bacterium]